MPDPHTTTLTINRSPKPLRPLTSDVLGVDHPSLDARYAFVLENGSARDRRLIFHFSAAQPYQAAPGSACGVFQAELWQHDCAEFFLVDPSTGRYLEFNVSPSGGWWSASFISVRVQDQEERFNDSVSCSTTSLDEDGLWAIEFSVPVSEIESAIGAPLESLCGNVTAILNSPDQVFLSAAKLGGTQPDYHIPQSWVPLVVA